MRDPALVVSPIGFATGTGITLGRIRFAHTCAIDHQARLNSVNKMPSGPYLTLLPEHPADRRTIESKIDWLEVEGELTPVGRSDCTGNYFSYETFIRLQGEYSMCDYSLDAVRSRAAKIGDQLISTRFPGTETRGFAALGEPGVAVCILPGTELVFEREIETVHAFAQLLPSFRFGMQGERLARFRRLDPRQPHVHHDALELPNGRGVLVTRLREGQRATVLQLPANSQFSKADEGRHQLIDQTSSLEIAHATYDCQ